MRKKYLVFIIFLFPYMIMSQSSQFKAIDLLLKESHANDVFNGSIFVSRNGETLYESDFGFTDGNKTAKIDKQTLFNIGSIAKEFYSTSIMFLVENNKLSLDERLSTFELGLPHWAKNIKVKHLLNYTSGLPRVKWRSIKNDNDAFKDIQTLDSLMFSPGVDYMYSNNNIFIQRKIIEKISGISFLEFVRKNILTPAGMSSSQFDVGIKNKHLASSFSNKGINDNVSVVSLTGWLYMTTNDMYKWLNYLHSGNFISQSSINTLFNSHTKTSQAGLGQGQFDGDQLLVHRHHGSHFNYESLIKYRKKDKLMIIQFTNNKNFKLGEISRAIENIIDNKEYSVPQKSVYLEIRENCYSNVELGIKYYYKLKKEFPKKYNFGNESELNRLGYKFIEKERFSDAVKIFKVGVSEFPNSSNLHDSLGEAYSRISKFSKSLRSYQKSLLLDSNNINAQKMIFKIEQIIAKKTKL